MRPADSLGDPPGPTPGRPKRRTPAAEVPPSGSSERFSHALRAAIATGAVETEVLRAALRLYVDDLRATEPPEKVLIAVKERVLIAVQRRSDVSRSEAGVLLNRIVHWTIEAYYRAD